MEYWEIIKETPRVKQYHADARQKRQDRLNRWLDRMARLPNISVVAVELQRRAEQSKINKL